MIILLLCIIAFVLIFGSRALLDSGFWILAIAAYFGLVALVIGAVVFLYHEPSFLIAGLALAGIGVVCYLIGEMK